MLLFFFCFPLVFLLRTGFQNLTIFINNEDYIQNMTQKLNCLGSNILSVQGPSEMFLKDIKLMKLYLTSLCVKINSRFHLMYDITSLDDYKYVFRYVSSEGNLY